MIKNVIERFNYLMEIIPTKLSEISEDDFSMKPDETKWSKKEILGHLVDSAANNHQRFIRVQYENIPKIDYDQIKWNDLNFYGELASRHIIEFWTIYNLHLLELIKRIPETSLAKTCDVGNNRILTLEFIIEDYLTHLEHHLREITDY